jgi:hypothetical protein
LNFPFLVGRCELTGRVDFSHAAGRGQDEILGKPKNQEKRRRQWKERGKGGRNQEKFLEVSA